jgi:hypothetical protein
VIQPEDVRMFLQDRPELNRILDEEEFKQDHIDFAMKLAVMSFNEMSPSSRYVVANFPYQYTLLLGTVWHLLFGGGLLRSRNRLPHQAGGVTVDDEAHGDIELQFSSQLKTEFEKNAQRNKIEANIRAGWGHVGSEYSGTLRNFLPNKPIGL